MATSTESPILTFYWRLVIKPRLGKCLILAALMIGSALLSMAVLGLGVPLLDTATNMDRISQNTIVQHIHAIYVRFNWPVTNEGLIFSLIGLVSLVYFIHGLFFLLDHSVMAAIAYGLKMDLKDKLFGNVLRGEYENTVVKSRGALVYDINAPTEALISVINQSSRLMRSLFDGIGILAFLFWLSGWTVVLVGLFSILWVGGWRSFIDHRAVKIGRKIYDLETQVSKLTVDSIDGLKVVKTHSLVPEILQRHMRLLKSQFRPQLFLSLMTNLPVTINQVTAALIMITLGALVMELHWIQMSFSQFVVFVVGMKQLAPNLATINGSFAVLQRERRNIETIDEVLHFLPQERVGGEKVEDVNEVRLLDVQFHYQSKPEMEVLKGVTCEFKKGTVTALVGPSGSGKSTLGSLLVGLYKPLSGDIQVNGMSLQKCDLNSWREKIAFVDQNTFLFNATIKENVVLWDEGISEEKVAWASKVAQLHDFVITLPDKYDTVVGDRGLKLSGGQCQRIALARALLRKPQVFVFDEATSALDNITERAVYNAITEVSSEAVVIVIAHRLSTVRDADQIVVLEAGKIIEQGKHTELMAKQGLYARLYSTESHHGEAASVSEQALTL